MDKSLESNHIDCDKTNRCEHNSLDKRCEKVTSRPKICLKCNVNKDPYDHHCSMCNKCVYRLDHHCFFIG